MTVALQVLKVLARLPLAARRRTLRTLWRATLPFRSKVGFGLEPALRRYLKVGAAASRRIALEHDYQDILLGMEWQASLRRNRQQMIADASRLRVNDPLLVERIAASGDVVILAPLHMGVFPFGITYVLWKYFAGRRLLILRARDDLAEHNAAMERMGEVASELRILNTRDETDFIDAMRFARKGAVVVSLLDLPESYGLPADVPLFGEPAAIALGLDAMARMLKAVVLPMTVISRPARDEIVFGQPFEVAGSGPAERAALAKQVARQIEQFVRIDPPQWHMWTRIAEFYPERVWIRKPPAPIDSEKVDAHVDL